MVSFIIDGMTRAFPIEILRRAIFDSSLIKYLSRMFCIAVNFLWNLREVSARIASKPYWIRRRRFDASGSRHVHLSCILVSIWRNYAWHLRDLLGTPYQIETKETCDQPGECGQKGKCLGGFPNGTVPSIHGTQAVKATANNSVKGIKKKSKSRKPCQSNYHINFYE